METVTHGRIEAALAVQREFMDKYGEQLEQMLSMGVYLFPVQDEEDDRAGFWSQAMFSIIDLFNLYRTVLLRSPEELPVCEPAPAGLVVEASPRASPQLRQRRLTYTLTAFVLRALRAIQVLLEMHAWRKRGPQHALRVCMRIEVVKLVLKMVLRSRMPFAFYVDEDAIEHAEPPKLLDSQRNPFAGGASAGSSSDSSAAPTPFVGRRSGRTLHLKAGSSAAEQLPPPRTAVGLRSDCSAATARVALAEALYHCRPLLHLVMLRRRGRKSWAAWLLAFLLERFSLELLTPHVLPRPDTRAAALELAEVRRRKNMLWWALARSPMFEKILQRPCETLDGILKKIPVINIFNTMELVLILQPFYFSTSGS